MTGRPVPLCFRDVIMVLAGATGMLFSNALCQSDWAMAAAMFFLSGGLTAGGMFVRRCGVQ